MGGRIIVRDQGATDAPTTTTASSAVFATGGNPGNGGQCTFPFMYRGQSYSECTCVDIGQAWCGLTSNFDADHKWGYCTGAFPQANKQSCGAGAAAGSLMASPFVASDSAHSVQPSSSSSSGSSANTGVVVGSVFGVIALLAIVAVAVFAVKKHYISQRYDQLFSTCILTFRVSFSLPPPSPKRAFAYVPSEEDGPHGPARRVSYTAGPIPFRHEDSL